MNINQANRILFASWSSRRSIRRSGLTRRCLVLLVDIPGFLLILFGHSGHLVGLSGSIVESAAELLWGVRGEVQGLVLALDVA
ncbi:hypothetical protein ACUY2E_10405 [Corynebacterium confusum]